MVRKGEKCRKIWWYKWLWRLKKALKVALNDWGWEFWKSYEGNNGKQREADKKFMILNKDRDFSQRYLTFM